MFKISKSGLSVAVALAVALSLSACTKKPQSSLLSEANGADGLNGGIAENGGQIPGSQGDLATNAGDRVFFAEDQSTLSADAKDTLLKQVAWLGKYPDVMVQIEGHADERGTREYNISLSARRATAARNFLIGQGVSGSRISTIAYGKERPAATCDTEECWSQNRRAVTVVMAGEKTS